MGARDDLLAIPDADLRDGTIAEAVLCWMDFGTGAKRWWAGFGDLDHAGHVWQGVGDVISISDLTTSYEMSADPLSFGFAATPEMIALAKANKTAVRGRQVVVYTQFFKTVAQDASVGPWQPLGSPIALFSGTMGPMTYAREGAQSQQIGLTCEGLWARRNAPPRGLWTDRDQQARHAGDKGLERTTLYINYETEWI